MRVRDEYRVKRAAADAAVTERKVTRITTDDAPIVEVQMVLPRRVSPLNSLLSRPERIA